MFKKISKFFLDLFFPKKCLGCGKSGAYICQPCLEKIEIAKDNRCPICGKISPNSAICHKCQEKYFLNRLIWAVPYSNSLIKNLIKVFKYHYIKELAGPLSKLLIKSLETFNFELPALPVRPEGGPAGRLTFSFTVIPIPLHKQRLRFRGFNQAELLAKEVAEHFSIPLETNVLERTRAVLAQAKIKNHKDRKENIKNIFKINSEFIKKCVKEGKNLLKNKIIILVDDVATTNATLSEAAKVLKEAGAKEVWGLVVAKG